MAYITNADIEARLGSATYVQLTDDSEGVANEARLGAEGEVDSYLACRYAVPVDVTAHPELAGPLKSLTLDLVEYRLWSRQPPVDDIVVQKQARALTWLKGVAGGTIDLPSATTLPPRPTRGPLAASSGDNRLLSRDEMSDY